MFASALRIFFFFKILLTFLIVFSYSIEIDSKFETVRLNSSQPLKRGKRFLDILPTTRMFYRVNCKNNIIPLPVIWANAYGFRANFPIDVQPKARPFRRDTYELMKEIMDKSGFDGEACILKAYCTAHLIDDENGREFRRHGMLFKFLKYIFTLDSHDKRHFPYLHLDNCQQILHSHCPLSFNSISPYTDDV